MVKQPKQSGKPGCGPCKPGVPPKPSPTKPGTPPKK